MATTTTGNVMSSGSLSELVSRTAIRNYQDKRMFVQFSKMVNLPAGHNTYEFIKTDAVSDTSGLLTEGVTPGEAAFNLTGISVALSEYGRHTILSNKVIRKSPVSVMTEASVELSNFVARKVDQAIQDVLDNETGNILYGGTVSVRTALDVGDTMTAELLAKAATELEANDAPKFGDTYVALMHPKTFYDLQQESGTGTYIDLHKYNESSLGKLHQGAGEVKGEMFGVTIITSSNVQFYADGGTGNVDVYPTYVFGKDAFGTVSSGGMQTIIKALGSEGSSDPLNQRASVGARDEVGFAVLKSEGLYRIETVSSLGDNT